MWSCPGITLHYIWSDLLPDHYITFEKTWSQHYITLHLKWPGPSITLHLIWPGPSITLHLKRPGPSITLHLKRPGPSITLHLIWPGPSITLHLKWPGPSRVKTVCRAHLRQWILQHLCYYVSTCVMNKVWNYIRFLFLQRSDQNWISPAQGRPRSDVEGSGRSCGSKI